jgi:hypothetical protein
MYCRADIIKAKPMWKPLPGSKYRQVFEFSDWVIKDVTREHKVTSREDFWKTGGTAVVTELMSSSAHILLKLLTFLNARINII